MRVIVQTVCVVFCLLGCSRKEATSLTIKGSDTEVNVVLELAEAYMAQDSAVSISVMGGGSGMGIAALLNQKTDIANSSRAFSEEERQLAKARHVWPVPFIFAIDALAFIVHPSVSVPNLTLDQLADIYTGRITNWQQVGGPNLRVSLYGRQSNSGTFIYLREQVLKADYSPRMKEMNGTAQIVEAVRSDPGAIGYVSVGYVANEAGKLMPGLRVVAIKKTSGEKARSPLDYSSIHSRRYPLVRPLYQYTNGQPVDKLAVFFRYEQSPEGQAIIRRNGYFPVAITLSDRQKMLSSQP